MPDYFPEGDTSKPSDDELRSLAKYCQIRFDANGPGTYVGFPEGNAPVPGDDEDRLLQKIDALK